MNVVAHAFSERLEVRRVQQFETADQQIFVLAGRDAGSPVLPARGAPPTVNRRPEQPKHYDPPSHICSYKYYPISYISRLLTPPASSRSRATTHTHSTR